MYKKVITRLLVRSGTVGACWMIVRITVAKSDHACKNRRGVRCRIALCPPHILSASGLATEPFYARQKLNWKRSSVSIIFVVEHGVGLKSVLEILKQAPT